MRKPINLSYGFLFFCFLAFVLFQNYGLSSNSNANSDVKVASQFSSFTDVVDTLLADSPDYVQLWIKVQLAELGVDQVPAIKKLGPNKYIIRKESSAKDGREVRLEIVDVRNGLFKVNDVTVRIDHSDRFVDVFQRVQKVIEVRSPGPFSVGTRPASKEFLLRLPKPVEENVEQIFLASGLIYHQM